MRNHFMRLLPVILLVIALCACGAQQNTNDAVSSEVTYFNGESTVAVNRDDIVSAVKAGTLAITYEDVSRTDVTKTVTLTMPSAELTEALGEDNYLREVGVRYIRYTCGGAYLYYTNDDRNNGLAAVVYYGEAYGFEPGATTKQDVLAVMGEADVQPAGEDAVSMFLFYDTESTFVDYPCGNNHIAFYFNREDALAAMVLYQDGLWIH